MRAGELIFNSWTQKGGRGTADADVLTQNCGMRGRSLRSVGCGVDRAIIFLGNCSTSGAPRRWRFMGVL